MITIKNLAFQYSKNVQLFNNLELILKPGNIYGLLGKNGAGKTTLLKIISGMQYPDKGECRLGGNLTSKRLPEVYQDIFFIPEEFALPHLSIERFVNIHAMFYPKFNFVEFAGYLNEFGLSSNDKIKKLSFGQKKMVIVCFGLAANTKYLILDEPTNALDIPSKAKLRKMLAGAISEERSFIISTHQIRDLENIIDPIIILDQGKIIFHHSCDNIVQGISFKILNDYSKEHVAYVEERMGGNACICENTDQAYSKVNLELLFNGVLQNSEKINEFIIKNSLHHESGI